MGSTDRISGLGTLDQDILDGTKIGMETNKDHNELHLDAKGDIDLHGTTMNLRKFRKATAKKRQLLDKEVYKKKKLRILEKEQEETSDLELSDQTSNTMTLEQFTDIVLASEGVTSTSVNNNNFKEEIIEDKEAEMEKNAMVATILQNKDLTVEVKTAKSKPIVLSPREKLNSNSVVVSVKPRFQGGGSAPAAALLPPRFTSQNLVEEWLQKMPTTLPTAEKLASGSESTTALNLSMPVKPLATASKSSTCSSQYSKLQNSNQNNGAFNLHSTPNMDSNKSRAIRDIQLAHTKDMHGNYPLHMSVLMRKPELVKRYCCVLHIIEANLDLLNEEKHTPLHLAVRDNSMEIIEILLAFGANPSVRDVRGNTGLHMATAVRSSEALKLLVDSVNSKDEINAFNNFGITPLHIAMMNDDKACVDILLRFGADPKTLNDLIKLSSMPKDVKKEASAPEVPDIIRKNVLIHS